MRKVSVKKAESLIKEYGLKPALQRDVSFLGHSMYAEVYVKDLVLFAGFGYGAVGGMWQDGVYQSMTNNQQITKNVQSFIHRDDSNLKSTRVRAMEKYKEGRTQFKITSKKFSEFPVETIKQTLKIYMNYFPALGFYNAIMRFMGDKRREAVGLSEEELAEIGRERNESATLYNDIEQFFKKNFLVLGNILNIDGSLIRFMSYKEVLSILNGEKIYKKILTEAGKRSNHYFYLLTDEKDAGEYLVSDKKGVNQIYNKYFFITGGDEIKGSVAFPGVVRGTVRILPPNLDPGKTKINSGDILVAVHTHPRYIELVNKSSAIVTDEGGTLSHAAIIARELKIPCIIGTQTATKVLHDGDLVEVDANKGVVRIIK